MAVDGIGGVRAAMKVVQIAQRIEVVTGRSNDRQLQLLAHGRARRTALVRFLASGSQDSAEAHLRWESSKNYQGRDPPALVSLDLYRYHDLHEHVPPPNTNRRKWQTKAQPGQSPTKPLRKKSSTSSSRPLTTASSRKGTRNLPLPYLISHLVHN
jgi:hypothetical protein